MENHNDLPCSIQNVVRLLVSMGQCLNGDFIDCELLLSQFEKLFINGDSTTKTVAEIENSIK